MKKTQLPYLSRKQRGDRVYWYFRKGNAYVRLPDNPDSQEFTDAYWRARSGRQKREIKTTWDALIQSYYQSPGFRSKSKNTRLNYRRHCEAIREKNGKKDMTTFRRAQAIAARDALADSWSKANERLAVLSILCKHAMDKEWIDRNPVSGIAKLSGGEYRAWPEEKLRAFENVARSTGNHAALTAYELAIGTGQRLGDCIKMRWRDFDGEFMKVIQEKTGAELWIYCPTRLRSYLGQLKKEGEFILAKNLTQPLGKRRVQLAIEAVRIAIGVKGGEDRLVPHGWRYTAAQRLAEAGCSDSDIQAVTGHRTLEMVQKYRRGAAQKAASKRAQLAAERNENKT
ncbi:site-specific integrase [Mangrovicoccus algicola]|uniref:Tyrosine-type recombinase/integrase n=1 Tax=Mangrovicoccus algicola TaxID=2771008 RepID=A0A8J6Z6R8_9RHOB|nr:tyrosine-type recombinase/integrase [Mangrovicoccus algicola]MBE3637490.1 tyrosine-type recombinase/integrase [Mangrovicoccus algicola]